MNTATVLENVEVLEQAWAKKIINNDRAEELLDNLLKSIISADVLRWGQYYFPDKFKEAFCEDLHGYLVETRSEEFTSTLAPRNHAKTTIKCFLIQLYQALNEPESFKHYLNIQSTSTKAVAINLAIRSELETNERLISDYGYQVSNEKWTEKQFVLKNGIIFTAIGAGESMRGVNYNNVRPDYIVADDIYDEDDINNLQRIEKKAQWFWGSVYPARSQTTKTSIHIQGTAINKKDLMHSCANLPGIKFKKFQSIIDHDNKITLWFDFDQLMQDKERMGSIIFEREMQNNCRDDKSSIIKERWLQFYDGVVPTEEKIIKKIGGVDPAIGEKAVNDATGKAVVYKTENANWYIHDIRNDRYSFNANIEDIKSIHNRYGLSELKLEGISGFQAFGQELRRTTNVPLRMITQVKDKISRLEAQSNKFENGKVFINRNINKKTLDEFIEQLINNFPNHDDMRDAVILCLEEEKAEVHVWDL